MNSKIVSTKRINAIFLGIILIAGTITAIFPSSFMIDAHAQPYYEVDNNYEKSKDSLIKNKIKCINDNINVNGENTGDINVDNKGQVANAGEEVYSGVSSSSSGNGEGYNYKKDKEFYCIIILYN